MAAYDHSVADSLCKDIAIMLLSEDGGGRCDVTGKAIFEVTV